jgi:hypothetical protein
MKALLVLAAAFPALLATAAASAEENAPKAVPEAAVQRTVNEDDQVRIEEVRVRGQTQSITVKSKIRGFAPYQILPGSGARDPSQPGQGSGQRVWNFVF